MAGACRPCFQQLLQCSKLACSSILTPQAALPGCPSIQLVHMISDQCRHVCALAESQNRFVCALPAVQPEELQWPWPELSGTPGGTLRLSADAASAEAGTCPAIAGGLRAATNGEPDSVGLQLVGSSRGVDGSRFVRPQTAGTTRVSLLSSSRALAGLLAGVVGHSFPVQAAGLCMKPLLATQLQGTIKLCHFRRTCLHGAA